MGLLLSLSACKSFVGLYRQANNVLIKRIQSQGLSVQVSGSTARLHRHSISQNLQSYDVPVLSTLLSREIINQGISLRLQMGSGHSGNQTRKGNNVAKTGLGARGVLTSMSFRFGWRVHLASDLLLHFFP